MTTLTIEFTTVHGNLKKKMALRATHRLYEALEGHFGDRNVNGPDFNFNFFLPHVSLLMNFGLKAIIPVLCRTIYD